MKLVRIFAAFALAAVLASGCESFRDDDASGKKEKKAAKTEKRRKKRNRDPRDDMFLGIGKGAKAESFYSDSLDPREKSLVDEELRRQDEDIRELRRRHRQMDSGRSKRKEWVYGFKPLGGDR